MRTRFGFRRRWLVWAVRILVLAIVVAGIWGTVRGAAENLDQQDWHARPGWLVLTGALYLAGLGSMACFWRRVLWAIGERIGWMRAVRAYYLGHLGKYTPGKAMVVVLRTGAVASVSRSSWLVVASTVFESLMMMGVGAFLAATAAVFAMHLSAGMVALAVLSAVVVVVPTVPPVARWIVGRIGKRFGGEVSKDATGDRGFRGITWWLWARGWLAGVLCWTLLGLSLWAQLRAIGVEDIRAGADLPMLIGAVALAVVAGFVSMLPGGLAVRDAVIMQMLATRYGKEKALVAAILLRLVWLVSEVVVCGILYGAARILRRDEPSK